MSRTQSFRCEFLNYSFKNICRTKCIALFMLAVQAVLAFPAAGQARANGELVPSSAPATTAAPQSEIAQETGSAAFTPGLAAIQKAIAGVRSPDLQGLAGALGLSHAQVGQRAFDNSTIGMEAITGLERGGISAMAVKWQSADEGRPQEGEPKLYLLSWTGEGWLASYLMEAADALTLEVLPGQENTAPLFAVIIYRGTTAVPYPVIFRLQNHHASLAWDGRSDAASYAGYGFGSIQFEKTPGGNVPVMITEGQADPGLLVFPVSQEQTGRGFQAATAYLWKSDGYVPFRTEYTHNRDYILYRFIAVLHLHDFKTAYSLIDPAQFLKTKEPTLDLFRERIQNDWPEFIDDRIFEVLARPEIDPEGHEFILRTGGGRINVYHPTFSASPSFRLTGLERSERSE
ncbi:MAG: hypothetical protein EPN47_14875 [Acidobacteria bacterium]|nr:MAG: hypothetical protein EPN47_14875 [Acidobacteriota bacterium]